MNTDPIADLLTRMRNGQQAHHQKVNAPYSKVKENILIVMKKMKFIEDYKVEQEGKFKTLEIVLNPERTDITMKRISRPGQRIYAKNSDLKSIKNGLGIRILSTPQGVMSNLEAKKLNLGGEILCELY